MCGGKKGPSQADLLAQEAAATKKAQAQTEQLQVVKEIEKAKSDTKILQDQVSMANADAARRAKNRSLLAGLAAEKGTTSTPFTTELEDPSSKSARKARRASLLGGI